MKLIKLPKRFFTDHEDRGLDTPRIICFSRRHVWVSATDSALPELKEDAKHYADKDGATAGEPTYAGLRSSARATLKAITQ